MPKLVNEVKLKKIILPSSVAGDEAWCIVRLNVTVGDVVNVEPTKDMKEAQLLTLVLLIAEWNFTDAEGKIEPITMETVRRMSVADASAIRKEVDIPAEVLDADKKKASS